MRSALADGPATDLAILELAGSTVDEHVDHLVVRTPSNPTFHWGNCVHVTTGDPDDVDRWLSIFHAAHPDADHVALGLPQLPTAPAAHRYEQAGLELDVDDALAMTGLPEQRPCPAGYSVRALAGADWEQDVALDLADNATSGRYEPSYHEVYVRRQSAARQRLVAAGHAVRVGAFDGKTLAASLGIVVLGEQARYQSVVTGPDHRRRGLASHLLGVAARWAHGEGARRLVIVTGATNPAGRVYRSVGFTPVPGGVNAYRPPVREPL